LLSLLIRRIATLISDKAVLIAQNEAAMKQASSATTAAQRMLDTQSKGDSCSDKDRVKYDTEINNLKEEVIALKKDRDAVKSQATSVSKEYDRLMSEYEKLEKKVKIAGGAGDKKSD
jgi:B-cell receptor-associated protein 31